VAINAFVSPVKDLRLDIKAIDNIDVTGINIIRILVIIFLCKFDYCVLNFIMFLNKLLAIHGTILEYLSKFLVA